ncbi:MAG TPA: TetR/AcrR family transcriptional regulator C-terminal domain-containing protein [Gaiellaceae bacterium]|nr:TetR/AcrR family transcriptional regulator C-terminal domain-containing protein [Gaiellaceae bacterium]
MALNRDRVVRAAVRLADKGGIESLTMRRLGQSLGVEAMSLYNHVRNKDDLLDGIVDLVLDEIELPAADGNWEAAVRRTAISAHDALRRHQWACSLVMSRFRPARIVYIDALLSTLREAGFSPQAAYHGYHALDSHILGFTLWELGHSMDTEGPAEAASAFLERFPADEYPYMIEHMHQHLDGSLRDGTGDFEFGLELILDGLKRMRAAT